MQDSNQLKIQLQELCRAINIVQADEHSRLLGRILTITDAALPDPKQRQAVKDLVEHTFYDRSGPYEHNIVTYEAEQLAQAHGFAGPLFPEAKAPAGHENRYSKI